jgi:hypothetical protein
MFRLFETLSTSTSQHQNETIIQLWFQQHDAVIDRKGPGGVALLSGLLPEKRADRVYGLSRARLESIIAESQGFGHNRLYESRRLQDHDGLDLASVSAGLGRKVPHAPRPYPLPLPMLAP